MSLAAAAVRLGSLVRGRLVGIVVTQHGDDPHHGVDTAAVGVGVPGPEPGSVLVQAQAHARWQTLAHVALSPGGSFGAQLPGPGRYRVWYGRLGGPAVSAGRRHPG